MGTNRIHSSSSGRGRGRGHHYTALELSDMDEVPLMMDDEVGVANSDEEAEEEEEDEEDEIADGRAWGRFGGRRRWQRRIRSHSTLLGLLCGGGWQVGLSKSVVVVVGGAVGGDLW